MSISSHSLHFFESPSLNKVQDIASSVVSLQSGRQRKAAVVREYLCGLWTHLLSSGLEVAPQPCSLGFPNCTGLKQALCFWDSAYASIRLCLPGSSQKCPWLLHQIYKKTMLGQVKANICFLQKQTKTKRLQTHRLLKTYKTRTACFWVCHYQWIASKGCQYKWDYI